MGDSCALFASFSDGISAFGGLDGFSRAIEGNFSGGLEGMGVVSFLSAGGSILPSFGFLFWFVNFGMFLFKITSFDFLNLSLALAIKPVAGDWSSPI